MLDLRRIAALIAVADTGSITQAANRLNFTPPAMSQQLAKLEKEIGSQLLIRRTNGCGLTPAGELLVKYGRDLLDQVGAVEDELALLSGNYAERCVIGSFATAGINIMPSVLSDLRGQFPGMKVQLVEMEPPDGLFAVAAGTIDFAVSHRYSGVQEPAVPEGVTEERIAEEEILVVVRERSGRPALPEPMTWPALSEQPLICGSPPMADRIALEATFESLGLGAPRVSYETANYDVALRLVEEDLGVALIPSMALPSGRAGTAVRRLTGPAFTRAITIAWRDGQPSAAVRVLRSLLRDQRISAGQRSGAQPPG
jgi:DNA-binding transcriptional LysR family regulator